MPEQTTCGQGLAAHSSLPLKLGELAAAMAEMLDVHTMALDLSDENATQEYRAYQKLVLEHRIVSAQLREIGEEMAGYRDLPMGPHDVSVITSGEATTAFQNVIKAEHALSALIQEQVEKHEKMLVMMRDGG